MSSRQDVSEQSSGWLDSEPLAQEVELPIVLPSQLVARVNEHLNLGLRQRTGVSSTLPRPANPWGG